MCEKELLVSYLYDDVSREDRARFESHLRGCAACRDELKALGAVRADLGGQGLEGRIQAETRRNPPGKQQEQLPEPLVDANLPFEPRAVAGTV